MDTQVISKVKRDDMPMELSAQGNAFGQHQLGPHLGRRGLSGVRVIDGGASGVATARTQWASRLEIDREDGGMNDAVKILRLNLKREYWEEISDGGKIYEFRLATPYWRKRLIGVRYDQIHLCLGYPKRSDEGRILKRKWRGSPPILNMKHKHFGTDYVDVFCIDVREEA